MSPLYSEVLRRACVDRGRRIHFKQYQGVICRNLCVLHLSNLRELCVKLFPIPDSSTLFTRFKKHRTKNDSLTSLFSIAASHFFTLAETSPLLANIYEKTHRVALLRQQIGTIVPTPRRLSPLPASSGLAATSPWLSFRSFFALLPLCLCGVPILSFLRMTNP